METPTKCYLTNLQVKILRASRSLREAFTVSELSEMLGGKYAPKVLYDNLGRNLGEDQEPLFDKSPVKRARGGYVEGYQLTDYGKAWAAWLEMPQEYKLKVTRPLVGQDTIELPKPTTIEIKNDDQFLNACYQAMGNIGVNDSVLLVARRFDSLIEFPKMKLMLDQAISSRKARMSIYLTPEADEKKVVQYLIDVCNRNTDNDVELWRISAEDYATSIGEKDRYVIVRDKAEVHIDGEKNGQRVGKGYLGSSPDHDKLRSALDKVKKEPLFESPSRALPVKPADEAAKAPG